MITAKYEIIIHSIQESEDGRAWPEPNDRHVLTFTGLDTQGTERLAYASAVALGRGKAGVTYTVNYLSCVAC